MLFPLVIYFEIRALSALNAFKKVNTICMHIEANLFGNRDGNNQVSYSLGVLNLLMPMHLYVFHFLTIICRLPRVLNIDIGIG